jgi:PAS domain S-box-containing protein
MSRRAFVICDDDDRKGPLAAQLERIGGVIVDDPTQADVIIALGGADDLSQRIAIARRPDNVPVLGLMDAASDTSFDGVDEVALEPIRDEELAARLDRLDRRKHGQRTRREQLLAIALEAAGDVVEITDARHIVEYVNAAFERVLGYTAEEVIGAPSGQQSRSQLQDARYYRRIREQLERGEPWAGLILSKAKGGQILQFDSTISPVFDGGGAVSHYVAVKRDVTKRVADEAELRALNEVLEQARDAALESSRIKSQFLANMSHELRTPLNAIIGYGEMLLESARERDDAAASGDLRRILAASRHLLALIDDVLDLSKIEAGQTTVSLEEVALPGLIDDILATIQPLAFERGNELVVQYALEYELVETDVTKLRQILLNLLSNSNKFTEHGPILLRVRPDDTPPVVDGEECFAIAISDTGIGMSPEVLSRIFQPFVQADPSTTRRYGGTGLGLPISQRYCEMMRGRISVESAPGEGSTFTVHLPRRAR